MAELRVLEATTPEQEREGSVRLLERYLELARGGEVAAVAIAIVKPGASASAHAWVGVRDGLRLLGAVSVLQHDLSAEINSSDG